MSSTNGRSNNNHRANMPVFGSYNNSSNNTQASIRLEKSNPGLRRSTPDSEALASSDEEFDHQRTKPSGNKHGPKPGRRTFSLADHVGDHPAIARKPSVTASTSYSPPNSNPTTPAADQNPWSTLSPSATAWGGTASGYPWNGSIWSQQEPPARLQELRAHENSEGLPFSIPLQPILKTHRSQSYSVGQLDPSSTASQPTPAAGSVDGSRNRNTTQFPALQRRTSRPTGMASGEIGGLGRVREVDDDDEETLDVTQKNVEQAREIERLELENARLRRERTMSSTAAMQMHISSSFRNTQIRGAVPEEIDEAIDDNDDYSGTGNVNSFAFRNALSRRFSEQLTQQPDRQPFASGDARGARWQTNIPRLADIPQSRRHSFAADAPTRHGSFGSQGAEHPGALDHASQNYEQTEDPMYFNLDEQRRLNAEASVQQGLFNANPYGIPAALNSYGAAGQSFVIVNFKCCRSDIFYVQDGTGLQIQVGDLVIVDADRGFDLGAVQHVHVSLEEARRYKEYYAEEHYKLLMMFSQQTKNGGMNAVNPNGPPTRQSAVGGMGPQGHSHRDGHGDPKAKMVKRLAQAHEIQALKEKEGNEAKAKRVCSAKVVEHGLNMEILDAEFQMDQKKLTFFYFADEYINFNSLVTDLFKIYKTRIWMSAINPASFQTPTSSLGITPAFNNPAFGGHAAEGSRPTPYAVGNGGGAQYDDSRPDARNRMGMPPPFYPYQPQPNMAHRMGNGMAPYGDNAHAPSMDPFAAYPAQQFGMFNQGTAQFGMNRQDRGNPQGPNAAWITQFHGLSMGS